jgi:hypothetical protein
MQTHTPPTHALASCTDERVLLLEEVDFKWLMAGQGWWIDTTRLHNDPAYATQLLDLVETTGLPALKDCATQLRAQVCAWH